MFKLRLAGSDSKRFSMAMAMTSLAMAVVMFLAASPPISAERCDHIFEPGDGWPTQTLSAQICFEGYFSQCAQNCDTSYSLYCSMGYFAPDCHCYCGDIQ